MKQLIEEFKDIKEICTTLMKTRHYAAMGEAGIFAIVQKCKAIGIDPMEGLNGGMYYLQGKVMMSSVLMAALIRKGGHSITCSSNTHEKCSLHGKRADTGDTWQASFSMEDAKRAMINKSPSWNKYPDQMLYNRALSKLARQLFPDVIGGCYVEGEIQVLQEDAGEGLKEIIMPEETISKNDIQKDVVDMKEECAKDPDLAERATCLLTAGAIKSIGEVPFKVAKKLRGE